MGVCEGMYACTRMPGRGGDVAGLGAHSGTKVARAVVFLAAWDAVVLPRSAICRRRRLPSLLGGSSTIRLKSCPADTARLTG